MKRLLSLAMRHRGMVGLGACAIAIALVSTWLFWPRVRLDNGLLIEPGMSQAEVEAILCAPPGNYGTPVLAKDLSKSMDLAFGIRKQRIETVHQWADDNGVLFVGFDKNGRVVDRWGVNSRPQRSTYLLDRIRGWLGIRDRVPEPIGNRAVAASCQLAGSQNHSRVIVPQAADRWILSLEG